MVTLKIKNCDLNQIAESGQCFRWQKIAENAYRIPAFGRVVEVTQEGDQFAFSCDEEEFYKIWREYFDLDTDYEKLIGAIDPNDTFLRKSAECGNGIRILRQEMWEIVLSFVISQNNNIPRIKKSIENVCGKYRAALPSDAVLHAVPCASQILLGGQEGLTDKSLGLGYRDEYIWGICEYLEDNPSFFSELRHKNYDDAMKNLMELKGIGKKVASCICLFGLHHLNACPVDTWMKKIIDEEYHGTMPDWMTGNYAGVYQQYAFYYKRKQARD